MYAGLHDFRDGESGKLLPFFVHSALVFGFLIIFLVPSQVIAEVWNLMQQWAQLFYRLEAVETMKAYISHNMDDNDELSAKLETVKGEATVARKLAGEGVGLMRKVEKEKEEAEAEAHR